MIYPWQTDDWNRLQQLRAQWPHALLLHGQAGIGKLQFAQHLAQGFLCESPQPNGEPCGACAACTWFSQGNHPDYRIVLPEALAGEAPGAADDPKAADADEGGKKTRAPSKEIKIEQVRALLDFCGVGSHRGGARVVVLYPAEALNVAASNALLKTLEEPPSGVVFLLVSARIDRLLPTIISRCRQWPMTVPAPDAAAAWLAAQGVEHADALLAEPAARRSPRWRSRATRTARCATTRSGSSRPVRRATRSRAARRCRNCRCRWCSAGCSAGCTTCSRSGWRARRATSRCMRRRSRAARKRSMRTRSRGS
ncbi:DNA polymerase III subunit delta' [Burkholderia cepacia]|nr:DNA polymerase III subunit delta' [Burkholderia cepacia]